MSDNPDLQDDGQDGDTHVTIPRANIRQLETAAREGKEAAARLAALEREMAFRDAGINPSDPKLKYFMKGYEGETSVDAIKAAAVEAGFLADPGAGSQQPSAPFSGIPQAELNSLTQLNATTAGVQQPNVSVTNEYMAALGQAKTEAETIAVMQRFGVPMPGMD